MTTSHFIKPGFIAVLTFSAFAPVVSAAVTYKFNTGSSGFTATMDASFAGPWLYGATGGVGNTGAWTTLGQVPENNQNLLNTARHTTPTMISEAGRYWFRSSTCSALSPPAVTGTAGPCS